MNNAVRILLLSALMLLGAGSLLYHYGSELNLKTQQQDQMLWEQTAGDKWLYTGGLMMLISGSLSLAAVKLWWGRSRNAAGSGSSLTGLRED
jgi:hypothetical protein